MVENQSRVIHGSCQEAEQGISAREEGARDQIQTLGSDPLTTQHTQECALLIPSSPPKPMKLTELKKTTVDLLGLLE